MSLDRRTGDYDFDVDSDVEVVEIVKRPGHSLGFYIREGNGADRKDGVFISRTTGDTSRPGSTTVQVGDEIVAVNGVEVRRMNLDDVVVLLSVPQKLALHVRRNSTPRRGAASTHRFAASSNSRQRKDTDGYYTGSPSSANGSTRQRLSDESADSDPQPGTSQGRDALSAGASGRHRSRLADAASSNRNGLQREAVTNRHGFQRGESGVVPDRRYRRQHSTSDVIQVDDNDSGLSSENSVNSRDYQQRAVPQNVAYSLHRTAHYATTPSSNRTFDPAAGLDQQRVRFDDARARYTAHTRAGARHAPHSDTDAYENENDNEAAFARPTADTDREPFDPSDGPGTSRTTRGKPKLARSLTAKEYNSDSELVRDANESFVSMNTPAGASTPSGDGQGRRWRSSNSVTLSSGGCAFCERSARESYASATLRRNATASDLPNGSAAPCFCPHCNSQMRTTAARHETASLRDASFATERGAIGSDDAQLAQLQLANLLASRKSDANGSQMTPMQSRLLLLERAAQRHTLATQPASSNLLSVQMPNSLLANSSGPFALQQSASALTSPSHGSALLQNGPARASRWQQLAQVQTSQPVSPNTTPITSVAGAYAALRRRQLFKQTSLDSLPFAGAEPASLVDGVLLTQNDLSLRSALSSSGVQVSGSLANVSGEQDPDSSAPGPQQAAIARLQQQIQTLCAGGSSAAQQLLNRLAPKPRSTPSSALGSQQASRLPSALQCLNKRADFNVDEFQPRASDRISRWGAGRPATDGLDGQLVVRVFGGRGLQAPASSSSGSSMNAVSSNSLIKDLYCVLELDSARRARTAIKTGIDEFEWDDFFELELDSTRVLTILVFNWDAAVAQLQHTLFYYANVSLLHFVQETQLATLTNPFAAASSNQSTGHKLALRLEPKGVLYVELCYRPLRTVLSRRSLSRPFANASGSAMFGVPLDVLVAREQQATNTSASASVNADGNMHVPIIVHRLIDEIEARGVDVHGLYQQACSGRAKQRLRDLLERVDPATVDLSADSVADVHVLAATLKDFLRELPEPLFTNSLYRMLVDSVGTQLRTGAASQNTATAGFAHLQNSKLLLSVLDCLPVANQCTVVYLLDHLKRVAKRCEVNKMTRANLAARFGTILLSPSTLDSFTNEQLVAETHKQVDCLKWLLDGWPDISSDRGYSLISSLSATAGSTVSLGSSSQSTMDVAAFTSIRRGRQLPVPPGYSQNLTTLSGATIPFSRANVPSEMNSPRPANSHMNMITDLR